VPNVVGVLSLDDARFLSMDVGLEWDEEDIQLLAPLVDAAFVWADDETLARVATPIVEVMWQNELREDLEGLGSRNRLNQDRVRRRHEPFRVGATADTASPTWL